MYIYKLNNILKFAYLKYLVVIEKNEFNREFK